MTNYEQLKLSGVQAQMPRLEVSNKLNKLNYYYYYKLTWKLFSSGCRSQNNSSAGLDIGYVPAGPHAFLRLSGQFGPPQFTFHWAEGQWIFFFF